MKKLVVANWKMKKSLAQSVAFAKEIKKVSVRGVDLVVAPSFTAIERVADVLKKSSVRVAGQDVAGVAEGSFTGDVSASMLKEAGAKYVIIGHSERRALHDEQGVDIANKMQQALAKKLTPILCVGETAAEKAAGRRDSVLVQQIKQATAGLGLHEKTRLVIAYEPVWAIGSGQVVSPHELEDARRVIRRAIALRVSSEYFDTQVRFLYGGSVTIENAAPLWALSFVQGFLIGGASLTVKSFATIAEMSQGVRVE